MDEINTDRQQISFNIDRENYRRIRLLAGVKSAMRDRNTKCRSISAAQLINEAIAEYIERNEELLKIIEVATMEP